MRKIGFVHAAAVLLGVISLALLLAPVQAQEGKRLWQGWIEEIQKIGAPPPPPAKATPPARPAKMKEEKK